MRHLWVYRTSTRVYPDCTCPRECSTRFGRCGVLEALGGVHMSSRSQGESAINGNAGRSATMLFGPALTFSVWEPIFASALKANAQAQEALGPIAGEWQAFVGHRLQEDMALMQRLAKSRTPEQGLTAYVAFWQKAAEDYGKEFATITKLMGRAASKVARASQVASAAVSWEQLSWQNAAA